MSTLKVNDLQATSGNTIIFNSDAQFGSNVAVHTNLNMLDGADFYFDSNTRFNGVFGLPDQHTNPKYQGTDGFERAISQYTLMTNKFNNSPCGFYLMPKGNDWDGLGKNYSIFAAFSAGEDYKNSTYSAMETWRTANTQLHYGNMYLAAKLGSTSKANTTVSTVSTADNDVNLSWSGTTGAGGDALFIGGTTKITASANSSLQCHVAAYGTTAWSVISDYRIKDNVQDIQYGIETINNLRPVEFVYNSKAGIQLEGQSKVGFIAHEVQSVIPQAVVGEKDGQSLQSLDTDSIVPVLVKAVQELSKEIDILKNNK